ncbi:MAG: MFS transporter [Candidatus Aminicenantales bacterium]|jgi:OHS family lactose permease-like MFS transporter
MIRKIHIINFVRKLTFTAALFLAPLHFLKLGFNGLEIGLIISCLSFAPIVFSFPTGWMNDRLSMKKVILMALLAQGFIFVLIGLVRGAGLMAFVFLLFGIANNALDVSANSLYYKDETDRNPNRKYGTYNFWLAVGPPIGLVAGGALTLYGGYRALLAVFAVLMALSTLALRGFGREKFSVVTIREYRSNILRKRTLAFSAFLFVLALHWGVEGTVYSPFLKGRFKLDDFQVSLYMALAYLALAGSSLFVSRLKVDPGRNRRLLLLGMMLSGLGLVLMVQSDVRLSFLFRVVHEAGDGLMGALVLLTISRLFEKRTIGGSAGLLMSLQTMGQMTGAVVFSSLGFRAGLQYPFFLAGGLLVANAVFGLYAVPREGGPAGTPA